MPEKERSHEPGGANPAYPEFQLARALATAGEHPDLATRQRALDKIGRWTRVLNGMISGALQIGSRRPITDLPVWVTPEVVTGGFATGSLPAGGPLLPHERELAARIAPAAPPTDRSALNRYFLTEPGLAELTGWLESGHYSLQFPEEGALLVMAWLAARQRPGEARELLDEIGPYFSQLRFYPAPAERPASFGERIFLEDVGQVIRRLDLIKRSPRLLAQRQAIKVRQPFHDRIVRHFLATVEGPVPTIDPDATGRWTDPATGRFRVIGGWPCRRYPAGWQERARLLLAEITAAHAAHGGGRESDSFDRLHELLERCTADPSALSGREVGMIRLLLARHIARWGEPDSTRHRDVRARQQRQVSGPLHADLARVVKERLARHPAESGLDEVDPELQPIADGVPIPPSLVRKVSRCLCSTMEELVARGIVTSGETMARIVPQFTAALRSADFEEPALRQLYASLYRAFRRRRSLLLLNLQHQIRLEELPWVAAIESHRRQNAGPGELSRRALREMAVLHLRAFPQTILPNRLLTEFRALAKGAGLDLPVTEELAADIFMNAFSPQVARVAKLALPTVAGSLYARYYAVDEEAIRRLVVDEGKGGALMRSGNLTSAKSFFTLCCDRAGEAVGPPQHSVVRNGKIIEQAQILTTHNLAALFQAFDLSRDLHGALAGMALHCFRWICRRQQAKSDNRHARLIMRKDTAYAWRQMIFYLSQLPADEIRPVLTALEAHLAAQPKAFHQRFTPALQGLFLAETAGACPEELRFLGWSRSSDLSFGV